MCIVSWRFWILIIIVVDSFFMLPGNRTVSKRCRRKQVTNNFTTDSRGGRIHIPETVRVPVSLWWILCMKVMIKVHKIWSSFTFVGKCSNYVSLVRGAPTRLDRPEIYSECQEITAWSSLSWDKYEKNYKSQNLIILNSHAETFNVITVPRRVFLWINGKIIRYVTKC